MGGRSKHGGTSRKLSMELLERREVLSSVTIISHGAKQDGLFAAEYPDDYDPGDSTPNDDEIRNALYNYFTNPAQYPAAGTETTVALNYHPSDGTLTRVDKILDNYVDSLVVVANPSLTYDNVIVMFDWLDESLIAGLGGGFDEAAGDALFAMAMEYGLTGSDYLHLIGMSRGHVVVSEATQRLLSHSVTVDQLTFLDGEEGFLQLNDAGPGRAWEGVGFVDNYYRHEDYVTGLNQLAGEPRDGAVNYAISLDASSPVYPSSIGTPDYYPEADLPKLNPNGTVNKPKNGKVDHPEVKEWYITSIGNNDPRYTSRGYAYRHDAAPPYAGCSASSYRQRELRHLRPTHASGAATVRCQWRLRLRPWNLWRLDRRVEVSRWRWVGGGRVRRVEPVPAAV